TTVLRWLLHAWVFVVLVALAALGGCTCGHESHLTSTAPIACVPQHAVFAAAARSDAPETVVAGTLASSFSVTSTGEAVISIPLVAPPGRAGIEPSLSIAYNSNAGDGALGMGFSLARLSAITRCAKTMAVDGEIRGVQYDADDALCLDG